jgi:hypothetical protein
MACPSLDQIGDDPDKDETCSTRLKLDDLE